LHHCQRARTGLNLDAGGWTAICVAAHFLPDFQHDPHVSAAHGATEDFRLGDVQPILGVFVCVLFTLKTGQPIAEFRAKRPFTACRSCLFPLPSGPYALASPRSSHVRTSIIPRFKLSFALPLRNSLAEIPSARLRAVRKIEVGAIRHGAGIVKDEATMKRKKGRFVTGRKGGICLCCRRYSQEGQEICRDCVEAGARIPRKVAMGKGGRSAR
jgi:hypothetical protein